MLRLLVTFFIILTLALIGVWLAELDGFVTIALPSYEIELPLLTAVIGLALAILLGLIVWKLLSGIWNAPARARRAMRRRRRRKAREAIVTGLIAAEAGETNRAMAFAARADRLSGDKALVRLLEARAALQAGNKRRAAEIYKEMLGSAKTKLLGMRGLYDLALEEERFAEAEELAHQARAISTDAGWAIEGVLTSQIQNEQWSDALKTVGAMADNRFIERARARRLRAVLLTARAMDRNETPDAAYVAAKEAHSLAPDLPPAALRAAELAAQRGDERKARKVLEAAYKAMPHPDVAEAYLALGHSVTNDERYKKAKKLAALQPEHWESHLLLAAAAIDARAFTEARAQLTQVLQSAPTARAFALMAELEEAENADTARAREWLSRALTAPRDPAWVADGLVSDEWAPVGPLSGRLDAYEWKVPVTSLGPQPVLSAADFAAVSAAGDAARPTVIVPAPVPEAETVPGREGEPVSAPATAQVEPAQPEPKGQEPRVAEGKGAGGPAAPSPAGKSAGTLGEKTGGKIAVAAPASPAAATPPVTGMAASDNIATLPRQPDDPGLAEDEEDEDAPVADLPRRM